MQMDKKEIGCKISAIRKEQGMTQKELAEKLHVTDKSVSKWDLFFLVWILRVQFLSL